MSRRNPLHPESVAPSRLRRSQQRPEHPGGAPVGLPPIVRCTTHLDLVLTGRRSATSRIRWRWPPAVRACLPTDPRLCPLNRHSQKCPHSSRWQETHVVSLEWHAITCHKGDRQGAFRFNSVYPSERLTCTNVAGRGSFRTRQRNFQTGYASSILVTRSIATVQVRGPFEAADRSPPRPTPAAP